MVIMGNPPYSVGQKSANDNAQNQKYEKLDARIAKTYAAGTDATNKNSLYDSYIKAFRWSTDRLDPNHGGVIAFVSNGAWIDGNSADGFRKSLEKEFSSVYVLNLRGNARTQGELRRKEAGNVFGGGSRTPIAITMLVKKPGKANSTTSINYYEIGDYLNREDKLAMLKKLSYVGNDKMIFQKLTPNEHGDWISQRNNLFETFISIGERVDKNVFFIPGIYCRGLETSRDAWVYNSNRQFLIDNLKRTIDFFNEQSFQFSKEKVLNPNLYAKDFLLFDERKISWSRAFVADIEKGKQKNFDKSKITIGVYRPFFRQHLYFSRDLNNVVSRMDSFFPTPNIINTVICVSGTTNKFSVIATNIIPDLHFNGDTQCFPLYYYEERQKQSPSLFDEAGESEYIRRDGVSDFILERAKAMYGKTVTKEDIFYYVYGFLHSPEYRVKFANDLKKMLPRLPLVEDVRDFWAFSKAGCKLADLHINYESVPTYKGVTVNGAEVLSFLDTEPANTNLFHVDKMRFPRKDQKDTIIYNSRITISNIPEEAYDYVVNGKSAIEWVMERYQITTHKESGIRNDPNDWAKEFGNPRYILDLLLSIINVSMQTVMIVDGLPGVRWE
jgi:predicted helicase